MWDRAVTYLEDAVAGHSLFVFESGHLNKIYACTAALRIVLKLGTCKRDPFNHYGYI